MAELLVELLSEEIPAGMQVPAAEQLQRLVVDALNEAELDFGDTAITSSAQRLVLAIDGLPLSLIHI